MAKENGPKAVTYGSYLKVPELLELQTCLSKPAHHDELQFIIVHQCYELWFKLVLFELDGVAAAMKEGDVQNALLWMNRVTTIHRHMLDQIHILETMDPLEFTGFRDELMPASGFQSYQFRELEFFGGHKDARFLKAFESEPHALERLERRLKEPSIRDRWCALMTAKGLEMPVGDSEQENETRLATLQQLYEHRGDHFELYLLAEKLIEWDELVALWRYHHVMMVERSIGMKRGTGGSSGAGYLRTTLEAKFFPELWAVRTRLGVGRESYGSGPSPLDLE